MCKSLRASIRNPFARSQKISSGLSNLYWGPHNGASSEFHGTLKCSGNTVISLHNSIITAFTFRPRRGGDKVEAVRVKFMSLFDFTREKRKERRACTPRVSCARSALRIQSKEIYIHRPMNHRYSTHVRHISRTGSLNYGATRRSVDSYNSRIGLNQSSRTGTEIILVVSHFLYVATF